MPGRAPDIESPYVGRFAPTPSGPLHLGSLVAAMASWLDARRANGQWLVRIEDLDTPRNVAGAASDILDTLSALGMRPDQALVRQSERLPLYGAALNTLADAGLTFWCSCSRREIADSRLPGTSNTLVYPGTCRGTRWPRPGKSAIRVTVGDDEICFDDRTFGRRCQALAKEVGDFVVLRADGIVTYQLAVVVDDGAQGITHVVRGADLIDSTPRQIYLQRCLGLPTPEYCHIPVVTNSRGEKLSKQTGAMPLGRLEPVEALELAASHLNLGAIRAGSVDQFWREALERYCNRETSLLYPQE
jgi:glutamyl-Q tRNA(Asp) synthetase